MSMKTIIKHTVIHAVCIVLMGTAAHAQTIKIDTLPGGDIEIKGLDLGSLYNDDMDIEKGKQEMLKNPDLMKEFRLSTSSMSSGGGGSLPYNPVFPTTYPNFKPCFCPVIMNSTAIDPAAPGSNIGFDEPGAKGISNWIFFMGMNRPWLAVIPSQAWFECERYYTGQMSNPQGTVPSGHTAFSWKQSQYIDFEKRTKVMTGTDGNDPVGDYPVVPPDGAPGNQALRLNRPEEVSYDNYYEKVWGSYNSAVMAVRKVRITSANPYLTYKYAVSLSNHFGHAAGDDAFFRAQVFKVSPDAFDGCSESETCCEELCCEGVFINAKAGSNVPGLQTDSTRSLTWGVGGTIPVNGDAKYKEWTSHTINFLPYLDGASSGDFIIAFTASYCKGNHDYGYAYVDLEMSTGITYNGIRCKGSTLTLKGPTGGSYGTITGDPETYQWQIYRVTGVGSETLVHTSTNTAANSTYAYQFLNDGDYRVQLNISSAFTSVNCAASGCSKTYSRIINILDCDSAFAYSCNDCIESFAPLPGKKYVMSAWVKQGHIPSTGATSYTEPSITISYTGSATTQTLIPSGPVIDGWQKIEQEFSIPSTATEIHLNLNGSNTVDHQIFYDDVRVFPFDGDMKSFVYDPSSQKLMAELDENNYATFYEYDDEGKLRRVKKETERGVLTIKEAGNNNSRR